MAKRKSEPESQETAVAVLEPEALTHEPALTQLAVITRQETRQQLLSAVQLMRDSLRSSVVTELTEVQADLRDSVLTELASRLAAVEEQLGRPTARILLPSLRKRVLALQSQLQALYRSMGMEEEAAEAAAKEVARELVPSLQ